jgi:glycosyltransferase involved in cell wall biosynthesis
MKFTIISSVPHIFLENKCFSYAPYVLEMNIWAKFVDELIIVAPISTIEISNIHLNYNHPNIIFLEVAHFDILNFRSLFQTVFKLPRICYTIYKGMLKADHIHLRCPGNMGLLGSLVQILFPKKSKTAKYAGNWDYSSKQSFTHKLQQKILSDTFLTKNMQVLVYGQWEGSSKNIKPFFTATYSENERKLIFLKNFSSKINFVFVGMLVEGKKPLYAIRLIEKLIKVGFNVGLDLYGEGFLRNTLEQYIQEKNLQNFVFLRGNQTKETLKSAYQKSHFVILPSESEGWPKAVAEGMFWGCVPLATKVSCVPYMLDYENRGIFLEINLENDAKALTSILENEVHFQSKSNLAAVWSNHYTLEFFESEIKKLIQK